MNASVEQAKLVEDEVCLFSKPALAYLHMEESQELYFLEDGSTSPILGDIYPLGDP